MLSLSHLTVPSPPPELSPAESRRKRQLDTYHTMCRQMGVIPVSFIEKRLMSKEIRMRSHGLGSNGAKALAVTLVVSGFHCIVFPCVIFGYGVMDIK